MTKRSKHVGIAIGVLLSMGGVVEAETHIVEAVGLNFIPQVIIVRPGDTVRWERVSMNHTVTSGLSCVPDGVYFDAPLNASNPVFEWVVPDDASGVIPYFCAPHCGLGMTGTISIDEGAFVRFSAVQGESVIGDFEDESTLAVTLGDAGRFHMGFEVTGEQAFFTAVVAGTGSLAIRDIGDGTTSSFPAGTYTVPLSGGSYGFFAKELTSLSLSWGQPSSSGSSSLLGGSDFIPRSITAPDGASIWSTTERDVETMWVGTTNESSTINVAFEATGSSVDRNLMWVGDLSTTTSGLSLPPEASDEFSTTFPLGESVLTLGQNGFFSIQLNNGSESSCVGDLNDDGIVNGADLTLLLGAWGICP